MRKAARFTGVNLSLYCLEKDELAIGSEHLEFLTIRAECNFRARRTWHELTKKFKVDKLRLISRGLYSIDGSIVLDKDVFDRFAPEFFRRSRRSMIFRGKVHLRGGRYLISGNPTFELRTKLETFREDLVEALEGLQGNRNLLMQLAMADYIKNSCVTMLNSFLQEEKLGKYRFDNRQYQSLRRSFVEYTNASVNLYYAILFKDGPRVLAAYRALEAGVDIFDRVQDRILESYKGGVFSSRHITRPEATHPLVIGGSVAQTTLFGPANIDLIIGLPAGSTELAFAHKFGQQVLRGSVPELLLFPVSFHSSKNEFDDSTDVENAIRRWVAHHKDRLKDKRILVVDDNSSTGRTIQAVVDSLERAKPAKVVVSISEADIVRSELDKENAFRPLIASKAAYRHSIHVLPISRFLRKKTDLKELTELRKMEACTRTRYLNESGTFTDHLIGKVYIDLIRNPTERVLEELSDEQIVRKFQKTALSNFAPVEVAYQGERFNSVEHAYQAMKFVSTTWSEVSDRDIEFINKKLEDSGESVTRADLPHIFSKQSMSPGGSKKVANYLRRLNYVREDWDDVKVPIMIDLLVQKYATDEYYEFLRSTQGKYLMEGNSWDDTFWGECKGRGRNFLGRTLMQLRTFEKNVLIREADKVREKLIAF